MSVSARLSVLCALLAPGLLALRAAGPTVAVPDPATAQSASASPPSATPFDRIRDGLMHVGQGVDDRALEVDHWLGSGFLADRACTIVTAKHLFDLADRRRIVVRYQTPGDRKTVETTRAVVVAEDAERDLAYLRMQTLDGKPCRASELHPLSLYPSFHPRALGGESVLIAGFPRLGPYDVDVPVARRGIVASAEGTDSKKNPILLLDLTGVAGFSGSPVLLERTGEVIGIVYGPGLIERFADFELATPIDQRDYAAAMRSLERPAAR